MGTLAEAALTALRGFAGEVATWTNQGTLVSITGHIAQIENAVATDVHAGETAAKAVLGELYGAFHGHAPAEPAPTPAPVTSSPTAPVAPATGGVVTATGPILVGESGDGCIVPPAPVAADPTSAPSTNTEASSAPSSTPSDSTTDTAAAPATESPAASDTPPAVAS